MTEYTLAHVLVPVFVAILIAAALGIALGVLYANTAQELKTKSSMLEEQISVSTETQLEVESYKESVDAMVQAYINWQNTEFAKADKTQQRAIAFDYTDPQAPGLISALGLSPGMTTDQYAGILNNAKVMFNKYINLTKDTQIEWMKNFMKSSSAILIAK